MEFDAKCADPSYLEQSMNRRRQAVGKFYGLLALTAAIWGIQPLFIKLAVQEITPVA